MIISFVLVVYECEIHFQMISVHIFSIKFQFPSVKYIDIGQTKDQLSFVLTTCALVILHLSRSWLVNWKKKRMKVIDFKRSKLVFGNKNSNNNNNNRKTNFIPMNNISVDRTFSSFTLICIYFYIFIFVHDFIAWNIKVNMKDVLEEKKWTTKLSHTRRTTFNESHHLHNKL